MQIWHEMQIGTNGRLCRFATRCRFAQEINARRARADLPGNADLHRKVTRGWTCADLPGNADLHRKATRGRTCADLPQFAKLHNKQINSPVQIVVRFHSLVNLGKEVFDGQQFKFGWLPEEGHQVDSRTSAVDSLTSRRNPLRCAWWWWRGNRRVFTCPVNYRNKFIVVFRSGFACSFLAVWCGWRPFFFSCGRRRRRSCDYTRLRVVVRICAGFRCSRQVVLFLLVQRRCWRCGLIGRGGGCRRCCGSGGGAGSVVLNRRRVRHLCFCFVVVVVVVVVLVFHLLLRGRSGSSSSGGGACCVVLNRRRRHLSFVVVVVVVVIIPLLVRGHYSRTVRLLFLLGVVVVSSRCRSHRCVVVRRWCHVVACCGSKGRTGGGRG